MQHSQKWLSRIDKVLNAVTSAHTVVGTASSTTRMVADFSQNTCLREVTREVTIATGVGDIFETIDNVANTIVSSAEDINTQLDTILSALGRDSFAQIT